MPGRGGSRLEGSQERRTGLSKRWRLTVGDRKPVLRSGCEEERSKERAEEAMGLELWFAGAAGWCLSMMFYLFICFFIENICDTLLTDN